MGKNTSLVVGVLAFLGILTLIAAFLPLGLLAAGAAIWWVVSVQAEETRRRERAKQARLESDDE